MRATDAHEGAALARGSRRPMSRVRRLAVWTVRIAIALALIVCQPGPGPSKAGAPHAPVAAASRLSGARAVSRDPLQVCRHQLRATAPGVFPESVVRRAASLDDYWRQVSYGNINLEGSRVLEWRGLASGRTNTAMRIGVCDWMKSARDCMGTVLDDIADAPACRAGARVQLQLGWESLCRASVRGDRRGPHVPQRDLALAAFQRRTHRLGARDGPRFRSTPLGERVRFALHRRLGHYGQRRQLSVRASSRRVRPNIPRHGRSYGSAGFPPAGSTGPHAGNRDGRTARTRRTGRRWLSGCHHRGLPRRRLWVRGGGAHARWL